MNISPLNNFHTSFGAKPIPTLVNDKELEKLFVLNNFYKCENGSFLKNISLKDKFVLSKKVGKYADYVEETISAPVSQDKIDAFKGFMALGKTADFVKKHFVEMFGMFSLMHRQFREFMDANKIYSDNKNYSELYQNIIVNPPKNKSLFESVRKYKGFDCGKINGRMRGTYQEKDNRIDKEIKDIKKYLDTQVVKEPIKLYRGEGMEVLEEIKFPNGKKIDWEKELGEARFNKSKLDALNKRFQNENITAIHPAFMSTSIEERTAKDFGHSGFYWELTTAPNTKACLIEPLQLNSQMFENEVLVQSNSKIRIKEIQYDEVAEAWCFKGEVSTD